MNAMMEKLDEIKEITKWLPWIPLVSTFVISFFAALLPQLLLKGFLQGDEPVTYSNAMGMFMITLVIALALTAAMRFKLSKKLKSG